METTVLVTAPTTTPVSLAEVKAQLRLDAADETEHTYLTGLLEAATAMAEVETGLCLMEQTWRLTFDGFPVSNEDTEWWDGVREGALSMLQEPAPVQLPKGPVMSVENVKVYAPDDTETTLQNTVYRLSAGGRVVLRQNQQWPTRLRPFDGCSIEYKTGHASAAVVPRDIRQAISMLVAHWYENREVINLDNVTATPVPFGPAAIFAKRRQVRL